ncbi:MAG: two-component regulator propeller domain-containing protein, partial [Chloroflexota bacterium]
MNRYDGYHFKIYRTTEDNTSLSSNYTENLFLDKHNNLWVCTSDGICRYNRSKDNFTRYYEERNTGQRSNFDVSDIVEDDNGTLWIATLTRDHYLLRYDEQEDQFVPHLEKSIQAPLNRIVPFDKDHLLISFAAGTLYLFNTSTYEYQKLPQTLPLPALKMVRTPDHTIWIGTDNGGLHAFRSEDLELQEFRNDPTNDSSISSDVIWDMEIRPDGNLWLATDKGLNLFDTQSFTAKSYQYDPNNPKSIASNFLFSVYEEDDGRIWVGTSEAGISLVHPSRKAFEHFHNQLGLGQSLSNNAIWAIDKDAQGNIWIGTSEGLNRLDLNDYSIERIFNDADDPASLSHNRVWAIRYDPFEDCIWLGTSFGLNRMDWTPNGACKFTSWQLDETDPQSLSSNSIRCLWIEEEGVWAGTTSDGLNFFNKSTGQSTRYRHHEQDSASLSGDRIRTLYKDSKDRLWIGTPSGLNLKVGDQFKRFYHLPNDPHTLSNNHVRAIREGTGNTFWIGTDYGLNKMEYLDNGKVSFTSYTTDDGLPNNRIYGIEMEGEQVWVSTNNGIAKYDPEADRFINFFAVDGIQSNEFNQGASYQEEEGFIYFGGINVLTRFLPKNVAAQDVRQDIVFTN